MRQRGSRAYIACPLCRWQRLSCLCRFHKETVELFESLHEGYFQHATSHIYNAIIASYLKVGLGWTQTCQAASACARSCTADHASVGRQRAACCCTNPDCRSSCAQQRCVLRCMLKFWL